MFTLVPGGIAGLSSLMTPASHCGICAEYCPCGVIEKQSDKMVINYTYCKGCGICTVECPKKAIDFVLEADCEKEGM